MPADFRLTWAQLANYAGMYRYDSAEVTTIQAIDDWHFVNGFTGGLFGGGWNFHPGEQLAITAYADNGDGKTEVTVAGHVLENGFIISISNTAHYDGVWQVEQVAVNTFVIDTPFGGDDGASVGEHGSGYHSGSTASAGKYLVAYSMSVTPGIKDRILEACIFCGVTQVIKSASQTFMEKAFGDYQVVSGQAILDIGFNEFINLAIRSLALKSNFTIKHGNMTLVRIG